MTAIGFIRTCFEMVFLFFFNVFKIPETENVYMGWIIISIIAMSMTVNALLNIPKSIAIKGGTKNG